MFAVRLKLCTSFDLKMFSVLLLFLVFSKSSSNIQTIGRQNFGNSKIINLSPSEVEFLSHYIVAQRGHFYVKLIVLPRSLRKGPRL